MIFKFLLGGASVPPYASYTPVMVTPPERAAAALLLTSGSSSDLTDKDLLKMMEKLEGLPSDMLVLTDSLLNFYIDSSGPFGSSTSNIASRYLSALSLMRTANFNNKQFENAYAQISKNGGINEYAINEHGLLYCLNKDNDVKLIRPEDLKDNKEYTPVTNAELLRMRAYDKSLAFNNQILGIVQNGIGMETVNEMITKTIQGLGTTESTTGGYVNTPQGQLINGLGTLKNAIASAQSLNVSFNGTTLDLYSYKIVTKDQKAQIDSAISYIYQTLPENAKALIKTKTKDGSNEEVLNYITALVSTKMSSSTDYTVKLEAGKTALKAAADKASKDKEKLNPAAMLLAGYGLKDTFTIQTAGGGSNGIQIQTVRMPVVDKEGKSMGMGTLADVASSGFGGYLDFEHATMGGSSILTSGMNNIAVNGTSLYVGELPIDMEEYSTTGLIKPDIKALDRLKLAQNKINKENITEPDKINAVYQEFKLPIMYGPDGNTLLNYKKFGILNATAFLQAFDQDVAFDDYLLETTDENAIKNALTIILKGRNNEDRLDFNEKGWFNSIFDSYDHVYKGTVFIPVNEDYFTGSAAFGDFPGINLAEDIEARQQALYRELMANQSYVNPGML